MYNFIDTTEVSEGAALPSEALQINGEYIENQIEGYRTLNVKGREALSPELALYETGIRDGAGLQNKRYPARIITVTYQIIAETNEAFRDAYNKLASILNVEEAELIFNDEQDKFFIGTPSAFGEVEPGKNAVVGSFEITCADPFKYSVYEYEAEPDLDESSIFVDYNGTYKAFPTLRAEFYNENEASEDGETVTELVGAGDCGYVAFFNENKKIIQLGNPDEINVDTAAYAKSQTLVNQKFNTSTSWGSAAKSLWKVNNGITHSSAVQQAGSPGIAVATYTEVSAPKEYTQTLLNITTKQSSPLFVYVLKVKSHGRKANSVKLSFTLTSRLYHNASYFLKGYELIGKIHAGGMTSNLTIKREWNEWWGKTAHINTATVTVTGLTASQTKISGVKFEVVRMDGLGEAGAVSAIVCPDIKISDFPTAQPQEYYLHPASFGSGTNRHGPSITRVLPADASGEVGAKNFTLSYAQKMSIGSGSNATTQLGAFQALLVSGSGTSRKIVAGVDIFKNASGKNAKLHFFVNHSLMQEMNIDLSYKNKYFNSAKSSTITKTGNTITFNICGIKKTFKDDDITDLVVNEVTFTFFQYGTKTALSYNGLFWAKFVKNNCTTYKDIPNKFSANDIVEADCKNGEIYLNGVSSAALGALGNDWEEFYLTPGLNQIGFSYSEWLTAEYAPKLKVRYREVFL